MSRMDPEGESHQQPKRKKVRREKPTLERIPATTEADVTGKSKFVRALGSTDYQTREKGLQALTRWMVHKENMTELDMLKIWKGLFYAFWHSDKAPVQVRFRSFCIAVHALLPMPPHYLSCHANVFVVAAAAILRECLLRASRYASILVSA